MADQIHIDRMKQHLLECLDETFNTTHGVYLDKGTSLFQTLNGVSATEASQKLSESTATIAAQVEHVRFYLDVLNEIMLTKQIVDIDWREIWNRVTTVTPDEWNELKQRLGDSHQRVMSTISSFRDWNGEYDFAGSLSILVHTAYHLGGIRQALAALRSQT